jgi:hypothetical protein
MQSDDDPTIREADFRLQDQEPLAGWLIWDA